MKIEKAAIQNADSRVIDEMAIHSFQELEEAICRAFALGQKARRLEGYAHPDEIEHVALSLSTERDGRVVWETIYDSTGASNLNAQHVGQIRAMAFDLLMDRD